jgi:hypothetical protein
MIAEHIHQLDSPDHLHPGRPRIVDVPLKNDGIRFCLRRRQERHPVTFFDVIDYRAENSIFVNGLTVYASVCRHGEKPVVQRAKYFEKECDEVSAEDLKVDVATGTARLASVPSGFFWNADETRVGSAKHMSPLDTIVTSGTKQGSVTVSEIWDGAQFTLRMAISAFSDSTDPCFISTNKTFEKAALEPQQLFEAHEHTIGMAPKIFITGTLFINWLETVFLCESMSFVKNLFMKARNPFCQWALDARDSPGHSLLRGEPHHAHSTGCTQLSHLAAVRIVCFRDFSDSV